MHAAIDREHDNAVKLSQALSEVKVLETFLPICAKCKKIRNEQGDWQNVEVYIQQHSNTQFSHGYRPECFKKEIEELRLSIDKNQNHDQYHWNIPADETLIIFQYLIITAIYIAKILLTH